MSASEPTQETEAEVTRIIQIVAGVRIAYGVLAIFFPRFWPRFFRLDPDDPDARMWNAFLGSRDIAIGIHSLKVAGDPGRRDDVILINQGCEVFDTILVGQEIRHGRPLSSFVTVAAIVFNAAMHGAWARVHLLRRG